MQLIDEHGMTVWHDVGAKLARVLFYFGSGADHFQD